MGKILTSVYDEIKRYEKVPNRREPVTLEMLRYAQLLAKKANDPLGLEAMLADWWEAALSGGFRLTEWAQDDEAYANPSKVRLNIFGDPTAFLLEDIEVKLLDHSLIQGLEVLSVTLTDVDELWLTFRTQKNGDHGQRRMFRRNKNPRGHCCVAALFRILQRFAILREGNDRNTTPLAVYRSKITATVRMVTASAITRHMRKVAAKVYRLNPTTHKDKLAKWTSHSLRVGACVMLHTHGFTAPQIQFLLRWKTDAFMVYLRNVAPLADKQNAAWDKEALLKAMPLFL